MSTRLFPGLIGLLTVTFVLSAAGAFAQQPRDPRPDVPRPPSARELQLQSAVAADPTKVANWLELAKLQETRGEISGAETSLRSAVAQSGGTREVLTTLAAFYNRTGQFEKTMDTLQQAALTNPTDPKGHQLVATYYWEKAFKDKSLTAADKARYIEEGIAATDRAIAIDGDYIEALTYKNILLRMKANGESDAVRRDTLFAEADALRNRALELQKARAQGSAATAPAAGAPPPPPPPPAPTQVDGQAPLRVGGTIKVPTKVRDVPPLYPPEARAAGVSGLVILEAVIETTGNVRSARVLRSIPMLDQAAIDAVQQWQFVPTLLNGVPVPVMMTVTVNFTIQ